MSAITFYLFLHTSPSFPILGSVLHTSASCDIPRRCRFPANSAPEDWIKCFIDRVEIMAHVSVNSISRQQMANASCPAFRGGFPTESSEVKDTRRHLPVGVWVSRRRQFWMLQHPPHWIAHQWNAFFTNWWRSLRGPGSPGGGGNLNVWGNTAKAAKVMQIRQIK